MKKKQVEDTYLSQAVAAAREAAAYDAQKKVSHRIGLAQGVIVNIRKGWEGEPSGNELIAMLETLFSGMDVEKKKEILEKEHGMVMTVGIEGKMQKMCSLSEGIIWDSWHEGRDEGRNEGIGQSILDLLEELGEIPADIRTRIAQESDTETLRGWHRAAAKTGSFGDFRKILS